MGDNDRPRLQNRLLSPIAACVSRKRVLFRVSLSANSKVDDLSAAWVDGTQPTGRKGARDGRLVNGRFTNFYILLSTAQSEVKMIVWTPVTHSDFMYLSSLNHETIKADLNVGKQSEANKSELSVNPLNKTIRNS